MSWLPYHHDLRFAFQATVGVRLHWFDRYAVTPDWRIEKSRLAADMMAFLFVERNSCTAMVNGRRWLLERGDLLVINGGDEFSVSHDPQRPLVTLSASMAFEEGGRVNALLHRKFDRYYRWRTPEEYVAMFEKVRTALASQSPGRELDITASLLHWLAYLLRCLRPPKASGGCEQRAIVDRILQAESWANARLTEVIALSAWARVAGLNATYFGRVFKRETGVSPMEWLNQRRLQRACHYLAATSKTVHEIAELCGFACPFYFSRVFRRHFGKSPVKYRQAHR